MLRTLQAIRSFACLVLELDLLEAFLAEMHPFLESWRKHVFVLIFDLVFEFSDSRMAVYFADGQFFAVAAECQLSIALFLAE